MCANAVVVLMQWTAGAVVVVRMVEARLRIVITTDCAVIIVIAFIETMIIETVRNLADEFQGEAIVIASVRDRSGAAAHQVPSNNRGEHQP